MVSQLDLVVSGLNPIITHHPRQNPLPTAGKYCSKMCKSKSNLNTNCPVVKSINM